MTFSSPSPPVRSLARLAPRCARALAQIRDVDQRVSRASQRRYLHTARLGAAPALDRRRRRRQIARLLLPSSPLVAAVVGVGRAICLRARRAVASSSPSSKRAAGSDCSHLKAPTPPTTRRAAFTLLLLSRRLAITLAHARAHRCLRRGESRSRSSGSSSSGSKRSVCDVFATCSPSHGRERLRARASRFLDEQQSRCPRAHAQVTRHKRRPPPPPRFHADAHKRARAAEID